uniref:DNA-binding protein n=1 Tax=Caldicellulosiruptor owensensis TaxID=55205 RepID=A0A7C5Z115_9FIRM
MMPRKILLLTILIFVNLICLFYYAFAKPVDSTTLLNNSFKYDGKTVEFQGEAIGEVMKRGKYAWVNIHDGQNAIGVFMKYEDAKKIKYLGRYRVKGDTILVKGTFFRSCKVHSGETDIHALDVQILERGYKLQEKIDMKKALFAIMLFSAGSILIWFVFKNKW